MSDNHQLESDYSAPITYNGGGVHHLRLRSPGPTGDILARGVRGGFLLVSVATNPVLLSIGLFLWDVRRTRRHR